VGHGIPHALGGARRNPRSSPMGQITESGAAEDEADLQAQLLAQQGGEAASPASVEKAPRQPRRQKLPRTCAASNTATSRRTPPAAAASRWSAWARTSASAWTSSTTWGYFWRSSRDGSTNPLRSGFIVFWCENPRKSAS
jgi:hypothetical protein